MVIFSELMDSKSLFLTANADTIYYLGVLDLTKGPLVIEVPPRQLGTFNDMWFGWIIDIGGPGPDRGEGGKYLIVPPGYDGPLPDSGFFVGTSKTNHVLYAVRAFMVNNDPKPAVESDQEGAEDLSLHARRFRHQHRHRAGRQSPAGSESARAADQVRRGAAASHSTPFLRTTLASSRCSTSSCSWSPPTSFDRGAHRAVCGHRHRQRQALQARRAA